MDALQIKQISVEADRMVLHVQLNEEAPKYSTPEIAQRLIECRPLLLHHACLNEKGDCFSAVMDSTSLPHLLEHVIIDLQVQAEDFAVEEGKRIPRATYTGTTEWIFEATGLARVEISYSDDLVALQAITDAVHIINESVMV